MVYHMQGTAVRLQRENMRKATKNGGKKGGVARAKSLLFYLFCAGILMGAVGFSQSSNPQKSFLGFRIYAVLSGSMEPRPGNSPGGFNRGDLLVVRLAAPGEIRVGDIVTFVPGHDTTAYLTHRVVQIRQEPEGPRLITRGDNNSVDDPAIAGDRLIGKKVLRIPGAGVILQLIQEHFLLFVAGAVALVLLLMRGRPEEQPHYRMATPREVRKSGRSP